MSELKPKLLERISLSFGFISLALTIYFSKNELFQIIFVAAAVIFFIAYFILQNSLQVKDLQETVGNIDERMKKMEESLNIYERLLKLEKEVFKNAKR